ncbi:E3 ubiquitin-protein ligase rnf213-beta-like [Saccostrea cucullata]|uniref:E3 ubiquitin-protein ligase rnf213-beta-like n=1 Tax=Saccostrea cuccullata TaxID=36930 RepID=UPI002ED1EB74
MWKCMGKFDYEHDPDTTYEVTADNVKKMLAIYMRFRAGIPVVIMGETGCGKTRLIKYLSQLQCPESHFQSMILMKIHGGTTEEDIKNKLFLANDIAQENVTKFGGDIFTILFFDEANTTEHIGLIKEVMCDGSFQGAPIELCPSLKIIAACNPYRRHGEDVIKRLEEAGLGYRVDATDTVDKLGKIPMRHLVYRVRPLPSSMLSLVWDFGQLDSSTEEQYIMQMAKKHTDEQMEISQRPITAIRGTFNLRNTNNIQTVVCKVLQESQDYMRNEKVQFIFKMETLPFYK